MAFEEADERREQQRLAETTSKLLCPDSGQVEKAAGPAVVAERCRKRGKAKSNGIIWSRRLQELDTAERMKEANWPES